MCVYPTSLGWSGILHICACGVYPARSSHIHRMRERQTDLQHIQRELKIVESELHLVNRHLKMSSNRLRDRKRISQVRSRSHRLPCPPPSSRFNNADIFHKAVRVYPRMQTNTFLNHRLRLSNERWETKLSRNATITDFFDRIQLDRKFAVSKDGAKLIPLSGRRPVGQEEIIWMDRTYVATLSGDFIRINLVKNETGIDNDRVKSDLDANNAQGRTVKFKDSIVKVEDDMQVKVEDDVQVKVEDDVQVKMEDHMPPNARASHSEGFGGIDENCRYFTRQGICMKDTKCPFKHDVSRVALCRQYLAGNCDACLLSHQATEFNTPICRYAFQDVCRNSNCKYSHNLPEQSNNPRFEIWTCRPFAIGGYCERGHSCPFAHILDCPDYEEDRTCPRGKSCSLQHNTTNRNQRWAGPPLSDRGAIVEKQIISSFTVNPELLFVKEHS